MSHEADDRWRRPVDSCIAGDELRDYSGTRSGEKIDAHYVVDDNIEPATEGSDCHNTAADHYPHDHSAEGHDHHHFASDRHDDDHDDDPNDDPNDDDDCSLGCQLHESVVLHERCRGK